MQKKWKLVLTGILLATMLAACTNADNVPSDSDNILTGEPITIVEPTLAPPPETTSSEEVATSESKTKATPEPDRKNQYRSELTGEWIDKELKDQRPVAIMMDNEILTYPHYGINQADVVYEIMNSTANGRITRFMCIVKDYAQIERFGGVRSIRPTNFLVGFPYEAIFCHDGGPFYINDYVAKKYCNHFSGIFARFTRPTTERPSWATSYAGGLMLPSSRSL